MAHRSLGSHARSTAQLLTLLAAGSWMACTARDLPTATHQSPPSGTGGASQLALYEDCASSCVLIASNAPLWSAAATDSAAVSVDVATARIVGVAGDSVMLSLDADTAFVNALPSNELLTVTAGTIVASVPLRDLVERRVVLRLASGDTTTVHYTLNRELARVPAGAVTLTQQTSARVEALTAPWISGGGASAHPLAAENAADSCSDAVPVNAAGTYCGVAVAFSPYAPADAFLGAGAQFQSNAGHGVSQPITITFDSPVHAVTVTAYDPTFNGNQMEAFDTAGTSLGVVGFPGNGIPGVLTTQTGTLTSAIARVVLTPAPLDYVAYSMNVTIGTSILSVSSAAGPNPGGSFTILGAESRIALQADVTPAALEPRVKWLVDDDPDDLVQTAPPANVTDGTPGTFDVPSAQSRARYTVYSHPGNLNQKSLSLRVRAQVTDDNGRTVESSNAVVVHQDEIDTMREEYIELHVPQRVPARSEFGPPDAAHPNAADYTEVLFNTSFDTKFSQLVTAWTMRPLLGTITGGYRNPVHNWRHITVRSGSGPVGASWHMYGCAIDMQIFPVLNASSNHADTLAARAYWDRLSAQAITLGFRVEPRDRDPNMPNRPYSGVGHVHVEIRCR